MLRNLNNKKYRNTSHVLQGIDKTQKFNTETLLSPSKLFKQPKIISKYKTGSESLVLKLVVKKTNRCIILKITPFFNSAINEIQAYSITNTLIERNVTPCIIKLHKLPSYILNKNKVHDKVKPLIKFDQSMVIATETYCFRLVNLNSVKLTQPLNLFFEVLYTLECFDRIGLTQSDLHPKNILIASLKGKKNYYNKYIYTSKNGITKTFYLPTTGQHCRIFDFDRAKNIQRKGIHKSLQMKKSLNKPQIDALSEFGTLYTYYDSKRDLNRFIFPFLQSHSYESEEFKLAHSLFNINNKGTPRIEYPKNILDKCSKHYLQYNYFVHHKTKKPISIPNKYLPTMDQMIMSSHFDSLTTIPDKSTVYTTYNINNIYS